MGAHAGAAAARAPFDWSELYARLHAFVRIRVHGAADADDLVQRILERAIEKSADADVENAASWLFAIARNAVADHYRAKARALLTHADGLEAEPVLGTADPERASVIASMEPLLGALPEQTAALLRWADMEGRSMQSIADELAITLTAAKSRVQRARKDFIRVTRECCAISVDARRRVVALTPKHSTPPSCIASAGCCGGEGEKA